MPQPWITFLSDYGLDDACVGVCHGVVAQFAPDTRVLDVCHSVDPQDVGHGATVLAGAISYLPVGVHLALVDPLQRTGSSRGVVIRTMDGALFVGPDNGLTSLSWAALGGVGAAWEITDRALYLPNATTVFRGRDVYAPIAARLSAGLPPERVGPGIDPSSLKRITPRRCAVDDDHVHGEVVDVDHFGNLALNMRRADLELAGITLGDLVEVRIDGRTLHVPFAVTYGEVSAGKVVVCEDALRRIMVAVNLGHAASSLRVRRGDALVVSRVPRQAPRHPVRLGVDTGATRTSGHLG